MNKQDTSKQQSSQPATVTISGDISLQDALEVMRSWGMRHLPVVSDENRLLGLMSERDIYRKKSIGKGHLSVEEAMLKSPLAMAPETPLEDVVQKMAETKAGSVVVVDPSHKVQGIFTSVDALSVLEQLLKGQRSGGPGPASLTLGSVLLR